jgi:hypothetical protein
MIVPGFGQFVRRDLNIYIDMGERTPSAHAGPIRLTTLVTYSEEV